MNQCDTLAYVAIGANLGSPVATVKAAIAALATLPQSRLIKVSSLYQTAPVGLRHQPDFINAVAMLATALAPLPLLDALFEIEAQFGRRRGIANAPRTLDLDLLLHGETALNQPDISNPQGGASCLILPHPRMHERAFVLEPLAEIAPDCRIPGHGAVSELLARCHGQRITRLISCQTA